MHGISEGSLVVIIAAFGGVESPADVDYDVASGEDSRIATTDDLGICILREQIRVQLH